MGLMNNNDYIIKISFWETLKIHFLAFCFGLWILIKRLCVQLWTAEYKQTPSRDSPPPFLADTLFGVHSYIKLKGTKLHYVEAGNKEKPLLLLLHGFPDFWLSWYHQIPVLSKHFRVVAVDLKGFGDSDKSLKKQNYQIKTIVTELYELICALGGCGIVVGHDLGAHLGWYLVTRYPDVVSKFVSISCPHPNVYWNHLPASSPFNTRWSHLCQVPNLAENEALRGDMKLIDDCFLHYHKEKKLDLVAAYKYTFSRLEDWVGPINYYRNLPFTRIKEGRSIKVPTLLIIGNKDNVVQLESVVKSTGYADRFIPRLVEGAGHYPHQQCPSVVNKILMDFLVVEEPLPPLKEQPKGLINSFYGAVTQYGTSIVDNVKKTTNDVVKIPTNILRPSS